jgi:hypothetical protein
LFGVVCLIEGVGAVCALVDCRGMDRMKWLVV